jgi:hypothetical protein
LFVCTSNGLRKHDALISKFKVKRRDGFLLAVFYAVVGVLQMLVFALSSYSVMPPHAGALAVLSLIAAYGLLRARKWAVWLVIILYFPQLVFGAISLNAGVVLYKIIPEFTVLLIDIALGVFIVLTFISFVYIAARRKTF